MSTLSKYTGNMFNQNTRSFSGYLDVDRVKDNPLYKFYMAEKVKQGASYSAIEGVYDSDSSFSISVGSNYEDQFELPFQDQVNKLMQTGNMMRNLQDASQFIVKSVRMTEQRWTGSTEPTFTVKVNIPIVRKKDAPWKMLQYCLKATSGTLQEYSPGGQVQRSESAFQIFAPNGYRIHYSNGANSKDTPYGTYAIALGAGSRCWFRMLDALITNIDYSIGNKKYYDGNPTSVVLTVSFKYWRYPLYEDIIKWFPLLHKGGAL